jgi:hypothetical protein
MIANRRSLLGLFVRLVVLSCLLVLTFNLRDAGVAQDDTGAANVAVFRTKDAAYPDLLALDALTLSDRASPTETGIDPAIKSYNIVF